MKASKKDIEAIKREYDSAPQPINDRVAEIIAESRKRQEEWVNSVRGGYKIMWLIPVLIGYTAALVTIIAIKILSER